MCEPLTKARPGVDWSKPIRWVAAWRGPNDDALGLHVVKSSPFESAIAWTLSGAGLCFAVVDSDGCRNGRPFIENVPEERFIVVRRDQHGRSWHMGPCAYHSEAEATRNWRRTISEGNAVIVKVPA